MKRKAGQAPSVRSAEVRSNALAPVRSGESNRPAPIRVEASRAPVLVLQVFIVLINSLQKRKTLELLFLNREKK